MSHLSILPTVIRDLDLLAASLADLGCDPIRAGVLEGFAGERTAVDLRVRLAGEQWIGWHRQPDGSLALLGDLQRLSRSRSLQTFLGRLTRRYAARLALKDAALVLPMASIELVS
ncbi:DUF1257 domain-containing protein [Synechococcus sp. BA-124 BA4]|uniref:DUF1257 domain-containing protein n=1 Tax=unclassified Synechococcus TaxID=2626047 RepID=UPI001E5339D2|nr:MULTISPECIES: DUF1257 domain-containing protein [unclassified Synechococcus]MEA5400523.1 DUF1257 domain-containing protein [Synechococcus sp. BA-124 BA4]CAK6698791.1 hypothetical protein BBFGKLBO_02526 [Synechococcus sp. CBW1107]